jgi:Protein tyrosine and serine/threonine kinase
MRFHYLLCFAEIFNKLTSNEYRNYRPTLPTSDSEQMIALCGLMKECWAEEPHDRPSFPEISKKLRHINNGQ